MRAYRVRDAVRVRDGLTACASNFIDNTLGRPGIIAITGNRRANVVDDKPRARLCHRQRNLPTDTAAGSRDDDDLSFDHSRGAHLGRSHSCF